MNISIAVSIMNMLLAIGLVIGVGMIVELLFPQIRNRYSWSEKEIADAIKKIFMR